MVRLPFVYIRISMQDLFVSNKICIFALGYQM